MLLGVPKRFPELLENIADAAAAMFMGLNGIGTNSCGSDFSGLLLNSDNPMSVLALPLIGIADIKSGIWGIPIIP